VCDSTYDVASGPHVALRVSGLRVLDEWFQTEFAKSVSRVQPNSPEAVHCGFDGPIVAVSDDLAVVDGLEAVMRYKSFISLEISGLLNPQIFETRLYTSKYPHEQS